MKPFIYIDYQKYNLDRHSEDKLIEISNDKVQEAIFHGSDNYSNFGVEVQINNLKKTQHASWQLNFKLLRNVFHFDLKIGKPEVSF